MDVEKKRDCISVNVLKGRMAEWFKAADCKSVEFLIVGSNPASFKY